jgi:hypothetical protein
MDLTSPKDQLSQKYTPANWKYHFLVWGLIVLGVGIVVDLNEIRLHIQPDYIFVAVPLLLLFNHVAWYFTKRDARGIAVKSVAVIMLTIFAIIYVASLLIAN